MPKRNDTPGNEEQFDEAPESLNKEEIIQEEVKSSGERDFDELVHSAKIKDDLNPDQEIDPDDAIHTVKPLRGNRDNPPDIDDLIHR